MEVLSLLQSENRCLEKLLSFSRQFLVQAQSGQWAELDEFDGTRQVYFKTLDLLDRKITEEAEVLKSSKTVLSAEDSARLQGELDRRRFTIDLILQADAILIRELEKETQLASGEAHSSRKNKEILSKFKSSWLPQLGSEMDNQI